MRLFLPAVSVLVLAWVGFSHAQTGVVQLMCPWGGNFDPHFLTINYDTRTMRVEGIDKAGNIGPLSGIVPESMQGLQSSFSDATVIADNQHWRYVLNRYSGILQVLNKYQNYTTYSQPCVPYERPSTRRF